MKTIIVGSDLQLGMEFNAQLLSRDIPLVSISGSDAALDNIKLLLNAMRVHQPTFVVNLVTRELFASGDASQYKRALQVTKNLAKACRSQGVVLIHLSDDSVFAGRKSGAYRERDKPDSKSPLAKHMLKAESYVCRRALKHIVLRTGPVISATGDNLFTKVFDRLRLGQHLEMSDNKICPTPATDVARVAIAMILQIGCGAEHWGVYQSACGDPASLYNFAEAIIATASQYGHIRREDVRLDQREADGEHVILNCHKIFSTFGIKQRTWRQSLPVMIAEHVG